MGWTQAMGQLALEAVRDGALGVAEVLWPRQCAVCGDARIEDAGGLVTGVDVCGQHRLTSRRAGVHCLVCAARLAPGIARGQRCAACRRRLPRFRRTLAAMDYASPEVRDWVLAFKHGGRRDLALPMARAMARAMLALEPAPGPRDYLVPVPLHAGRRMDRGYNQAALLAQALATQDCGRLLPILRRLRATESQGDPSAPSRRRNVAAAFRALGRVPASRRQAQVWIVDDVLTTGSTADACAAALWAAGFRRIGVLCFARA